MNDNLASKQTFIDITTHFMSYLSSISSELQDIN